MKIAILTFLCSVILLACNNSTEEKEANSETDINLETTVSNTPDVDQNESEIINLDLSQVEKMDYQELYESGELKIQGNYDEYQQRHGVWTSYYETGVKWSESHYTNGVKNGHSIAFFPSGKVRYMGDYKDDVKIGLWRFYDEDGTLVTEETYEKIDP